MFQYRPQNSEKDRGTAPLVLDTRVAENTSLLHQHQDDHTTSLRDLFQKQQPAVEVPIQPVVQDSLKSHRSILCCTTQCLSSTSIGSVTFLLYHVVFCLAQASTITRPHATTSILGPVAKMAALGILTASPVFIFFLGHDVPAIYPTSDLFLAPFLANLASTIDGELYQDGLQDDNTVFLVTFAAVSGAGLLLGGVLCILAARVKLANLGAFLPYSVLCGFFTAIGLLMWTLAFSVDTGGLKIGPVLLSGDLGLMRHCLLHHAPSFAIGSTMYVLGKQHPFLVMFLIIGTIVGSYILMWLTGTTLTEAQNMKWFWTSEDLINPDNPGLGFRNWAPPAPFGALRSISKVHWNAFQQGLPTVCALAFLYLIRCSLHTAALKKNIPLLTRKQPESSGRESPMRGLPTEKSSKRPPVSLQRILEQGYGYSQLMAAILGGIAVAPAVGASLTLFKLGAEGVAPQYGSVALVLLFYLTDFQLVSYLPKPAFSCLLILSFLDLFVTWLIQSYQKTKHKWEWMVTPIIVVLTLVVGLLNAILLGIAISTFVFVASFYRSGVVKYLANGLTVRSTIERGQQESQWLDQNGDLIQIMVLQNYLFFGNAQSILSYISTMFDDSRAETDAEVELQLPPQPRHLVLDFTIVTGMDTSAMDLLGEIISLCQTNKCQLCLAGLSNPLRSNLIHAGLKPAAKGFSFQPHLEAALGKAEDSLLKEVYHVVEKDEHDAGVRRKARSLSNADDGFRFALAQIDEQHGIDYASKLGSLEKYTTVVELAPGESLFEEEGGTLSELERGFFFIEHGLMTVETRVTSVTTRAGRWEARPEADASIGHLNARAPTLGRQDAQWKQRKIRDAAAAQSYRLARIGTGWVVGTIEGCSGMRNPGQHVAVTPCRLHLLPFVRVAEIERKNPALILCLFRLVSLLAARRQELTIEQLAQLMTMMTSPAHTSEAINRATLAALQR